MPNFVYSRLLLFLNTEHVTIKEDSKDIIKHKNRACCTLFCILCNKGINVTSELCSNNKLYIFNIISRVVNW